MRAPGPRCSEQKQLRLCVGFSVPMTTLTLSRLPIFGERLEGLLPGPVLSGPVSDLVPVPSGADDGSPRAVLLSPPPHLASTPGTAPQLPSSPLSTGDPPHLPGPTGPGSGLSRAWRPALTPCLAFTLHTPLAQSHGIRHRVLTSHPGTRGLPRGTQLSPTRAQTSTQGTQTCSCRTSCAHAPHTHARAFAHVEKELPGQAWPQGRSRAHQLPTRSGPGQAPPRR